MLLLISPMSALAQARGGDSSSFETPYNPHAPYSTWSVKGKILPWFLGNGGGVSGFAGIEYGFCRNQSIGIDGFLYLEESSDDNTQDTAGVTHAIGRYWSSVERAVMVDYRYYFNFPRLRSKGVVLYLLAYGRLGHISRHYDPLYPADYLDHRETHRSVGINPGTTILFGPGSRWGVDINAGVFVKEKTIFTSYVDKPAVSGKSTGPGFRLSANIELWFKRRTG